MSKSFLVTVTNDLNQDQRMHRICNALIDEEYEVMLVGRKKKNSQQLLKQRFNQKRLKCYFSKGILFYLEFNIRLLFFALKHKPDVYYAVDLDSLTGVGLAASISGKKIIHDAHEYFVEVPELEGQRFKKWIWNSVGKLFVPKCDLCFTVNEELVEILSKKYNNTFYALKSVPYLNKTMEVPTKSGPFTVLYQGVLNKGRGLEESIRAIHHMDEELVFKIAGEGDLSKELRALVDKLSAHNKIKFLGWKTPAELKDETLRADVGLNLLSSESLNYKYSLANKFFDYMHAGVPSINMDFPVYKRICNSFDVGLCIDSLNEDSIQTALRLLISDKDKREKMKDACLKARAFYNWQLESQKLTTLIKKLF